MPAAATVPSHPDGHARGRGQHQGRRGDRHGIGPDPRRPEPLGQPIGQRERPVFADRLIGQAAGQLLVGREDRLGPVEPPEHGRLRSPRRGGAAAAAGRHRRSGLSAARRRRPSAGPAPAPAATEPLADQLAQLAVVFRPSMHGDRLARRSQLERQLGDVADHGPPQDDLGRDQAARTPRTGIDRGLLRPSRHPYASLRLTGPLPRWCVPEPKSNPDSTHLPRAGLPCPVAPIRPDPIPVRLSPEACHASKSLRRCVRRLVARSS